MREGPILRHPIAGCGCEKAVKKTIPTERKLYETELCRD